MSDLDYYNQVSRFLIALAYTQPRILGMFLIIPIFNRQLVPPLILFAIGAVIGVFAVPIVMPVLAGITLSEAQIVLLILKEAVLGFVLGFMVTIPFWAFEAIGFLIDNQRGASVAATLNPLTGNDSSPLGILFNQAFIVFFFLSGGFVLLLGLIYDSFVLWDIFTWMPRLRPESTDLFISQINRLVQIALLLAAPALVAMFLSELGLGLVSRFVPQLQVFFLAMPIKCAMAMMILLLYFANLFQYALPYVLEIPDQLQTLNEHWMHSPPPFHGAER